MTAALLPSIYNIVGICKEITAFILSI